MKGFVEENCTVSFAGKTFESGGSYLWPNPKTGRLEGILYHYSDGNVGTWHGDRKAFTKWGRKYRGNMGDVRQSCQVAWEIDGKPIVLSGTWYKGGDIVRVKEIKRRVAK